MVTEVHLVAMVMVWMEAHKGDIGKILLAPVRMLGQALVTQQQVKQPNKHQAQRTVFRSTCETVA